MKKNKKDTKKTKPDSSDDKIHVSKSVLSTAREMQAQRQIEMEERERKAIDLRQQREKQKREAYDRRIMEERKELLRMKQAQTEESEILPAAEPAPEAVKRTPLQKIRSFFYLNKWWLGIAAVIVALAAFLIYDLATRENPDMVVLLITDNAELNQTPMLEKYLESFTQDFNNNKEIHTAVHYIPYSDNYRTNYAYGVDTKLTVEFESADASIIIAGDKLSDLLVPEDTFVDLTEMFPDNPHVKGCKFFLKGTSFAEKVSVSEDSVTDDLYLAVRAPEKLLYDEKEAMQKTYDKDIEAFKAIIADLSE